MIKTFCDFCKLEAKTRKARIVASLKVLELDLCTDCAKRTIGIIEELMNKP